MPAEWAELDDAEAAGRVKVGIETERGPWVAALVAAGYEVFAINPKATPRYRERHSMSGAKSDPGDAHVLAEIVRLDRAHHRPVAGDSATVRRSSWSPAAHQTMIWERTRHVLRLRSAHCATTSRSAGVRRSGRAPDALELLAAAPDPDRAARLTKVKITGALHPSPAPQCCCPRARDPAVVAEPRRCGNPLRCRPPSPRSPSARYG